MNEDKNTMTTEEETKLYNFVKKALRSGIRGEQLRWRIENNFKTTTDHEIIIAHANVDFFIHNNKKDI